MTIDALKLRLAVEDSGKNQSGGFRAIFEAAGVRAFTRLNGRETFQKVTPRVELYAQIGRCTGRRFAAPDGVLRYDAFHFILSAQAATASKSTPSDNELHENFVSEVRAVVSRVGGSLSYLDVVNFPLIYFPEVLADDGVQDSVSENGFEFSVLQFSGIVCVRNSAWG